MGLKQVAFVSPVGNGGPKVLYQDITKALHNITDLYSTTLISSVREWISLHFYNKKYDIIISSVPFLWKPPHCSYILQQHGFHRVERGFSSIGNILTWLYPYNALFSSIIIFPSEFLLDYCHYSHNNQKVIYNLSSFPVTQKKETSLGDKKEIILSTVTGFSFYDKARGMLDIFEKLEKIDIDKKIHYYVCGDGKYLSLIQEKLNNYSLPKNIEVTFLGRLDKKEVLELITKTDIFLYSTFQETFGISIIEAMSSGIPVILNDYSLFYELYDKEFIAQNNIAFAEKFNNLILDDNYYQNYINKGKINIEKFDKNTIIQQWHDLIIYTLPLPG